jgi:hypothetical protein
MNPLRQVDAVFQNGRGLPYSPTLSRPLEIHSLPATENSDEPNWFDRPQIHFSG